MLWNYTLTVQPFCIACIAFTSYYVLQLSVILSMSGIQDQIRDAAARNSELLATLSRTDYAIPTLKQQIAQIRELEAEERRNNDRLKKLSNSREKELKDHKKYNESVMKRFAVSARLASLAYLIPVSPYADVI